MNSTGHIPLTYINTLQSTASIKHIFKIFYARCLQVVQPIYLLQFSTLVKHLTKTSDLRITKFRQSQNFDSRHIRKKS